jgi:hyperosmotically inducible protein
MFPAKAGLNLDEGRMIMNLRRLVPGLVTVALALSVSIQGAMASERGTERLDNQVRHELNMLPYVNAFDYLAFTADGNGNVVLSGEVTNPVVKRDAGRVVKTIEGVEHVDNQIRVLPASFFDNGLRIRLFRTIYGDPALEKYALGVNKSIRIIVDNGHVTLIGFVDNQTDKNIAGIRANGVPGIFSVDNQLQVITG